MAGCKILTVNLPTDYSEAMLRERIAKELGIRSFHHQIDTQSLDARKKNNIHWLVKVSVVSDELAEGAQPREPRLEIPRNAKGKKAIVVGSGPAGFFSALVLQKAGFHTTVFERGAEVARRSEGIAHFEKTGEFSPLGNYAFGEGGAGTFSDGKLTSRTKNISLEKDFIIQSYIRAGAPNEIAYLAHPHIGSDNLKVVVKNLRTEFLALGGVIHFETLLEDLQVHDGSVTHAVTAKGIHPADVFVVAPGHSSLETYRMMIRRGVQFRIKNFAIGSRMEHPRELINRAQWGSATLPGIKAAEYRLTSKADGQLPVYSFCMCPGGVVVPAAAYEGTNVVNGMSDYARALPFSNAGCVAGIHLEQLLKRPLHALEALDWLDALEQKFFVSVKGYQAPSCTIQEFLSGRGGSTIKASSFPLGLQSAPLWEMLPAEVVASLREGLKDFSRKLRGFEKGTLLGLESKTSSPIQVVKEESGLCAGFSNLYLVGEGSGYAGGIISSGTHGIKTAMKIAAEAAGA